MPQAFSASTANDAAVAWLEAIGWQVAHGPDIASRMPAAEQRLAEVEPGARPSARSRRHLVGRQPQ